MEERSSRLYSKYSRNSVRGFDRGDVQASGLRQRLREILERVEA